MKSVAKLNSVTHQYGDVTAVDDMTLDIPSGCMVGLIGPDGVGKSTVLALISGVRKLQSGSVEVLGVDIDNAIAHRSADLRVGAVVDRNRLV